MEEQQQQRIHQSVLDCIKRLTSGLHEPHLLWINGHGQDVAVDRHSLQYMVDFLDNGDNSRAVTILKLDFLRLPHPPDGGLQVLRSFFARSGTCLTKVKLLYCNFGSQEEASQFVSSFQTNRTVTDLEIRPIRNLEGGALGNSLSILIQTMPQLQRLYCDWCALSVEGVRAFQPALQANRTLKKLNLCCCHIGDEGIHLIADALVGNTTIEVLDIRGFNYITSNGLDDITRLIESTQLKMINLFGNNAVFDNADATQHFVSTLQHKKSSLEALPDITPQWFPGSIGAATSVSIHNSLIRNRQRHNNNVNSGMRHP